MKEVNSIDDVEVEIRRALLVLKSLPSGVGPAKLRAYWPDYVSSDNSDLEESVYFKPYPDEIDDMDIVFDKWLKVLSLEERRLVLFRCEGHGWKAVQNKFKMSRSAAYNRFVRDLKEILAFVLEDQKKQTGGDYDFL